MRSKEIEREISSNNDLKGIVNAMKAFAGLNIRKTAASLSNVREYKRNVKAALDRIARHFPKIAGALKSHGRKIQIVFGSDLGLCGSFNERLADYVAKTAGNGDLVFVVGKKLSEKLDIAGFIYAESLGTVTTVDGVGSAMLESFARISKIYSDDAVTDIVFVFTRLSDENDSTEIVSEKVLPPEYAWPPTDETEMPLLYVSPELALEGIIEEFLYISLYGCYVESLLAENWLRFRSMDGALENLDVKIKELDGLYKFFRQEEITEEIIEVIESHSLKNDARA